MNAAGELTDRSNLEYKIYRISWSWWWENRDESFGTYINSSSITPVAKGHIRTTGGKATFKFRVNYPNWGCTVRPGRSNKSDPSGIKMLAFSLDKDTYEIGETVTAILPAAAGGRALVSVENGSTVLQREG